ncbi:MAG: nicotinate (nicotinamide) nucleotide adenylyltransferase [Thermomicrobiales bacterium]|nr:nicotinate (nicotinamide) nucleotide adenylyltransferase [Thermomicrobiales bacterium]
MTARQMRIGFFGGTFDPIHHGHLILASYAASSAGLDRLLFAPAANPPHKQRAITPIGHRIEMLLRAIEHDSRFEMTTVDLEREGPHYSADTLAILAEKNPAAELFFLMGSDSYRDLPSWYEPLRLFEHARLLVGLRPNSLVDEQELWKALPPARTQTEFVDIPLIEISSTEIRQRVSERLPIDYLVPRSVQAYIQETGLYLDAVERTDGRRILD